MRFSIFFSALAFVASALADGPNSFNLPTGTLVFTAGQAKTITWSNLSGSTVTLLLRQGPQNDLTTVQTLVSGYQNSGTYTWTPATTLPEGNTYAIEIINEQDTSEINYTTQFDIISNVHAVASGTLTSLATAAEPTGSSMPSGSTAAASGSMTGSTNGSMTATGSMTSMTGSATGSSSASKAATASGTVPTNAAAKPAVGAAGALLAVAAGFAIAL